MKLQAVPYWLPQSQLMCSLSHREQTDRSWGLSLGGAAEMALRAPPGIKSPQMGGLAHLSWHRWGLRCEHVQVPPAKLEAHSQICVSSAKRQVTPNHKFLPQGSPF